MADKKADNDTNAEDFQPPKFDEEGFIHKEVTAFRSTAILFIWGVVAAIVSWVAFHFLDGKDEGWYVGLAIMAAMALSLKWVLPKFGAEIGHYKRKEWLGTSFLFFLTWLSFFLIAVNPPVSDYAAPQVQIYASPGVAEPGQDVLLSILAADNVKVDGQPTLLVAHDGTPVDGLVLEADGAGHFKTHFTAQSGAYHIMATANDGQRTGSGHANLTVQQALTIDAPDLDSASDRIVVKPNGVQRCPLSKPLQHAPCIVGVTLTGNARAIVMTYKEDVGGWQADANSAGFVEGANNLTVHAEFLDRFLGARRIDGGELVDGPFNVQVNGPLGSFVPKDKKEAPVPQPSAPDRPTPGLEVALVGAALVGVTWVARRKASM